MSELCSECKKELDPHEDWFCADCFYNFTSQPDPHLD
jgi:hypothetical protein